jgi:hypothetical protein
MKNQASCLCGGVQWEITAEPFNAFNCHCKMCRKAHGSAFCTCWFVKPEELNWLSDTDTIVHYGSSHLLTRSFCGTCGSVVPYLSEHGEDHWAVPGGCHDDGKKSDCHVFAAHSAPWYDITDDLPRHDDYPDYTGMERVEEEALEPGPEGIVRGSCLCGTVIYEISEPFTLVQNCHCHRCRKARAAAHATNGFTSMDGVKFTQGEDNLAFYKVPDAKYFTQVFCKTCGSKMPRLDPGRGIAVVPFGGLDDDPGVKPERHIYVEDMAKWYQITDDLPVFDQEPTS